MLVLPGGSFGAGARPAAGPELIARFALRGGTYFGTSVALARSGKVAVVGEPAPTGGTAWVFTHRSTLAESWDRFALHGGDKSSGFGTSVAISGDGKIVLVGAPYDNRRTKGTAWIFRKSGNSWIGQKLRPNDESGQAVFGYSVALSANGSIALVGAYRDKKGAGAAWVFVRSGATWKQRGRKLTGQSEVGASEFGRSVALSGDGSLALIGGPADKKDSGAAWVFAKSGSTWKQQGTKLTSPKKDAKKVGWDVALSADERLALIGGAGGAALFAHTPSSRWVRRQGLSEASLGASVALSASGNTAATGAGTSPYTGKAHVYTCASFGCVAPQELTVQQDTPVSDRYGRDVAAADDRATVLVGAPGAKAPQSGLVWVFLNSPLVESVLPPAGPTAGATAVTITGENFTKVRGVSFGTTPAASYTVDSSERIHAVSPPGTGTVHVRVTTAVSISPEVGGGWGSGVFDTFAYLDRPVVTSITPTSGPTAGGTQVTITGTNLAYGPVVRFGNVTAASPSIGTGPGQPDRLTVTTPPHQAGTVDVTVTTPGGTSATGAAARFTYVGPVTEKLITFEDLSTGGPGGAGSLVVVNSQYAGQGVTFNDLSAIDYSKGGSALPGFAHSGTVALESCVGVELCTNPIRATFSAPQKLVRVWVGFSFKLDQPIQVQLKAFAGASAVGTATATLPANPSVTNISTPLEVQVASATITKVEVSVPGGYDNALAVDDVTFQS